MDRRVLLAMGLAVLSGCGSRPSTTLQSGSEGGVMVATDVEALAAAAIFIHPLSGVKGKRNYDAALADGRLFRVPNGTTVEVLRTIPSLLDDMPSLKMAEVVLKDIPARPRPASEATKIDEWMREKQAALRDAALQLQSGRRVFCYYSTIQED